MNTTRQNPHPRSARFRASVARAALLLASTVALTAQTNPPASTTKEETLTLEKFVVTGSFIPLSAEVNASPVITIERGKISETGATDALALLKKVTPVFQGNGNISQELNNGGSGESNLALRNVSTLVLLNGRRMGASARSAGTAVNLNTIPVGMIERVEILKDSASTIYGSDAIGGVVNVILRKDFDGFEVGSRFGSDSSGDYLTRETWMLGGVSKPGASIIMGAQYFENSTLTSLDRKLARLSPAELVALGQSSSVLPNYMSSTFAGRIGNDMLAGSPLAVGAPGYNANVQSLGLRSSPTSPGLTAADLRAAGLLIPINTAPLSITAGGSATILNTAEYPNPVILPTKRYQFFANGSMELYGKRLEVFGDLLYADTINGGSGLAPAPLATLVANNLTIPANNPYNVFGVTAGVGGAANAPAVRARLEELPNRSRDNEDQTWRVVAGLKGEFNDRLRWEGALNYTKSASTSTIYGGAIGSVMNQLLTPLIANGNYVFNAQGRPLSNATNALGANLPVWNYFALPGFNSPESVAALRATLFRSNQADQRSLDFRVVGALLALPAGDLNFAAGGEVRRERTSSQADSNFTTGGALGYNPSATFVGGTRRTSALFLEALAPLARPEQNFPYAHRAELTAAIRTEKIEPGGNARSPKFGLRWLPFDDQFVVRGTWAKGFIAPSIFSLFGPPVGNSPSFSVLEGNGQTSPGGSTGRVITGQFVTASQLSNPTLLASESTSLTAGFVYSPKRIKGLSLSADYYKVEQDKVGSFDYTFIYQSLNALGSNSPYAAGFRFADGSRLTTTTPNQVTSTNSSTLTVLFDPQGDQWTDGVDLSANYSRQTDGWGYFGVGASANVLFNFQFRTSPTGQYFQYARDFTDDLNGKGGANGLLPSWTARAYGNWSYGNLRVSTNLTHVPEVRASGTAFGNGPAAVNTQRADGRPYFVPAYNVVDLSASYELPHFGREWAKSVRLTVGVNNLFDEEPPFVPGGGSGSSESNTNKQTYDFVGRFMFVELRKQF